MKPSTTLPLSLLLTLATASPLARPPATPNQPTPRPLSLPTPLAGSWLDTLSSHLPTISKSTFDLNHIHLPDLGIFIPTLPLTKSTKPCGHKHRIIPDETPSVSPDRLPASVFLPPNNEDEEKAEGKKGMQLFGNEAGHKQRLENADNADNDASATQTVMAFGDVEITVKETIKSHPSHVQQSNRRHPRGFRLAKPETWIPNPETWMPPNPAFFPSSRKIAEAIAGISDESERKGENEQEVKDEQDKQDKQEAEDKQAETSTTSQAPATSIISQAPYQPEPKPWMLEWIEREADNENPPVVDMFSCMVMFIFLCMFVVVELCAHYGMRVVGGVRRALALTRLRLMGWRGQRRGEIYLEDGRGGREMGMAGVGYGGGEKGEKRSLD